MSSVNTDGIPFWGCPLNSPDLGPNETIWSIVNKQIVKIQKKKQISIQLCPGYNYVVTSREEVTQ